MTPEMLDQYRQKLLRMRQQAIDDGQHLKQSIQEDVNASGNLSAVPMHLADVASEALDPDLRVLETECDILDNIELALARIQAGSYGACQQCGSPIADERLEAIPYASRCIECARQAATEGTTRATRGRVIREDAKMKLIGYEAIEYAEKEGFRLNKAADSIDDERTGLTIAEAQAIAEEDPDLIWLVVPADEYYGEQKNMEPGR